MATTCKLIAKTTLGSAASQIEFTSIPGTYTDLLLLVSLRSASTGGDWRMRFNGSTSSIYSMRSIRGSAVNATSASESSQTSTWLGNAPLSDSTANTFGSIEVYIPNYAGSSNKSASTTNVRENNSSSSLADILAIAQLWASTAAITSITIYQADGNNVAANSSAFLYGITKA